MRLHLFVPGSLHQRTGGYLYDAHMVRGLRDAGWRVEVVELQGDFPDGDAPAVEAFAARLDAVPEGEAVLVDGLAGGAHPELLRTAATVRPVVALVHHPLGDETGLPDDRSRRLLKLECEGLEAAHGVVVTSPFTARRLRKLGIDGAKIRVVIPGTELPEPLDDDGGAPLEGDVDDAMPASEAPLLLSVGSVTPRKGHDVLVEALAGLDDAPWHAVIVGSEARAPEFSAKVRERVRAAGLGDRITFTGEVAGRALERWWHRADVFVLPSWYEGYGMALTEALLHGLPVVSTRAGAIPDTVPDATGILVSPGAVTELRRALRTVITDVDVRRGLADAARAHAASLPDWATQARAFATALEEIVARA